MSRNERGLGYMQKHLLGWMRIYDQLSRANGYGGKRFSIQRDRETRRVAMSLERRGLIRINRDFECWTVRLA